MKRWLPHPLLSFALLAMWLLLQHSLAPTDVLLGLILAGLIPRLWARLEPPALRLASGFVALRLALRVAGDILWSNLMVMRRIWSRRAEPASGFVTIPLELRDPWGLAVLAAIISATPGTVWVSHDARRQLLVIHVLELVDAATSAGTIKQRYERPLMEILQC
ncbi:MAG: Na+/H+ antiporter subunit E [Nevskiaceae bacterium]|nr:MAG: Na+/H+ antiporter subunit E [Nevskiaceae bacterium]TBR72775.1 MAG: Na+/H+ antiporter subunit E [Nevskiaceae bacterium]